MKKVILCLILVFNVGFGLDFDKALNGCIVKSVVRAFEIFNKGCENNVSESCYEASIHYLEGKGTSHSFEGSTVTLLKACDLGSKRACQILTYLPQE